MGVCPAGDGKLNHAAILATAGLRNLRLNLLQILQCTQATLHSTHADALYKQMKHKQLLMIIASGLLLHNPQPDQLNRSHAMFKVIPPHTHTSASAGCHPAAAHDGTAAAAAAAAAP